ncbi:MAG: mechanosensitive ion channel [Clostridia bacterium]|nr:mechanosensitive ion channel [Clostridia bacterium]
MDDFNQMQTTVEKFIDAGIDWLKDFLPNLLGAILILIVGMWLSGVISSITSKAMEKAKIGKEVVTFAHSFVKNAVKILVIVAAVGTLGFNIASLITALGAATVAIGLALQDSLKNIASGVTILINKPFKVGDFIEAGNLQGTVTRIDIASTHLLTLDNKEIIIPNSNIASSNLVNYSSQEKRRVDLSYGVSYKSDIDFVRSVIKKVIAEQNLIFTDPEPFIAVGKHGDNSIEIVVRIWCKTSNYWSVYHYMQENVKKAFDKNKIEIPFTQIDIHNS